MAADVLQVVDPSSLSTMLKSGGRRNQKGEWMMSDKTLLDALIEQGWRVSRNCPYFTDFDGKNPDRYIEMIDPEGKSRKSLESLLNKPFCG